MKESFQRVVAWAKAHPLLAAVILGAVILVAYLVYKKNAASGAGASATADTGATSTPDLSGLGNVGGMGALGGGGGGGGATSETGGASGGKTTVRKVGKGPVPVKLSSLDAMLPGYDSSLAGLYSGVDVTGALAVDHQASAVSGAANASGFDLRDAISAGPTSTYSSGPGGKVTNKTVKPKQSKTQTPSQLVGKGAKFTGWFQGVQYVNGYPVTGSVANVQPVGGAPGKYTVVSGGGMGNKVTDVIRPML